MENIKKILDCIYEYAIDNCLVLDKNESKINFNTLYRFLYNYCDLEFCDKLEKRFNDCFFKNWDYVEKFNVIYNIKNLHFIPNANCMCKFFQENINILDDKEDRFYLIFKSYLGHYVLLYVERQKGKNYAYCFDSVYGSVEYIPNNDIIKVIKDNTVNLLYPTACRQYTNIGCLSDALSIARDIDNLGLDIIYMYKCYKEKVIMPFLITHIERYDTMAVLKEQLKNCKSRGCVFIPKDEFELNLFLKPNNLLKCKFEEKQDGYVVDVKDLLKNNIFSGRVKTRYSNDYDVYQDVDKINMLNTDFVFVNFPDRDKSLKSILNYVVLDEMQEEIDNIANEELKKKLTKELKPILAYYDAYESVDAGHTILYQNLNSATNEISDLLGFRKVNGK